MEKIKNQKARSIIDIIRCKNGWSLYDVNKPQYTDIKLNVLVKANTHHGVDQIIAEIQFLLDLMSKFKKTAHKLYSVERKVELVFNFQKLGDKMATFKDVEGEKGAWIEVTQQDDENAFKELWHSHKHSIQLLTDNNTLDIYKQPVFNILSSTSGKIHHYLLNTAKEMYIESILYIVKQCDKLGGYSWDIFLHNISLIQRIFDLFDDEQRLNRFVLCTKWREHTLFETLSQHKDKESLKYILLSAKIPDHDKCKAFAQKSMLSKISSNDLYELLKTIKQEENDKAILDKLMKISKPLITVHKAFNYFTVNTPDDDKESEYKMVDDTDTDRSLFCFGNGKNGRIGIKHYLNQKCLIPTICKPFTHDNCLNVALGNCYSLCVDKYGAVYSFGDNHSGQLGTTNKENMHSPYLLKSLTSYRAVQVAAGCAGWGHSSILLADGSVWSFGTNKKGVLGHNDDTIKDILTPKRIEALKDKHIVQITCGSYHYCAVSRDGELWCWGSNKFGQCGVDSAVDAVKCPIRVHLKHDKEPLLAAYCAAGPSHTLLITTHGLLLSWGNNEGGGLGHGSKEKRTNISAPTLIQSLRSMRIIDIAAGERYCLCVDENGKIYSWGYGDVGQLGHGDRTNKDEPKRIAFFENRNIKIIECDAATHHSAAISTNGDLYMFGSNDYGELGIGDTKAHLEPIKVKYFDNIPVSFVSLGKSHSAVITGKPDISKMGLNKDEEEHKNEVEVVFKSGDTIHKKRSKEDKVYSFWTKNKQLFGDNDWYCVQRVFRGELSDCSMIFLNGLEMKEKDNVAVIVFEGFEDESNSDQYIEEIVQSEYILCVQNSKDTENTLQIKQEINEETDTLYRFKDMNNIEFNVPLSTTNKKNILLYVKPPNAIHFFLVKQFN